MEDNANLQYYISRLGLPHAIYFTVASVYAKMDARLWIIENSNAMTKRDSKLLKAIANFERIECKEGVSRWAELSQCIDFHSKMSARCWIPTKYWFVNDPPDGLPKRFGLCWGSKDDMVGELEQVNSIMSDVCLDSKENPLGRQFRKIERYLSREAARLEECEQYVGVVICTQGVPTDECGNRGEDVMEAFVKNLISLSKLPVKIIFRLCTDDDQVVDFYNTLDTNDQCACDVLDDFWGEAYEVYLHNPWLTYGIGIHRLREAGLGTALMDALDEKSLSLEEIHEFCTEFFIGNQSISLNSPCNDFPGFIMELEKILLKEKLVYNPCKKKLCPWIDVDKLKTMFRRASVRGTEMRRRGSYCREPPGIEELRRLRSINRQRHSDPQQSFRRGKSEYNAQSPKSTAPAKVARSKSDFALPMSRDNGSSQYNRSPKRSKPKDLAEAIQRWSHVPPDWKRLKPMAKLLVNVPILFPATNEFVEDHAHFDKWKDFSEDAFAGVSGDELKNLLKRAAKKAKLFLHPDKLPNDLTENQTLLFKSIWDVIHESEAKTLAD